MFAPIVAVCLLGGDCELLKRSDNKVYKTYEECVVETTEDVKQISEYLFSRGIIASVGFKCEEDKDSV